MKQPSYRNQDYAFGQLMLTLRTAIGLTQAGLGDSLGVSRRSVADWEAGGKYPKPEHLKQLIILAIKHRAFHPGREAEEIRALWNVSRQKVLLDELWLADLLADDLPMAPANPVDGPQASARVDQASDHRRHVDWGEALTVRSFYGREWELRELTSWVIGEHCRLISVLGIGGIGKSTLSVRLMHQLADQFDVVIWRSLRDAPTCDALLDDCLRVLDPVSPANVQDHFEQRFNHLLDHLRERRVLIVLDNLEALFDEGERAGQMRSDYADYDRLMTRIAATEHQGCLILTSREKPQSLVPFEGARSSARVLRLAQLEAKPCEELLHEIGVSGTDSEQVRLIDAYGGNPLALKIVAQTIIDLFDGNIGLFLEQGEIVFGGVSKLLAEQFVRLSALEQSLMISLAIMREPSTIDELMAVLGTPVRRAQLLEAMDSLYRRSLIERGQRQGCFTLQSVVLEYATLRLITEVAGEILAGEPQRLIAHSLELTYVREYVRQTQERLIVAPVFDLLHSSRLNNAQIEERLLALLAQLSLLGEHEQGYGPANLVTLLRVLRGDLRGLDLSRLVLRGVYLQGIDMQDARLADSTVRDAIFTTSFDSMSEVAISPNGEYWAAASRRFEVRLWGMGGETLLRAWQAHSAYIWGLAFSPDSKTLATASWDSTIKLWDIASGALIWSGRHTGFVNRVSFSPDGRLLASAGSDDCVRLWIADDGTQLPRIVHPVGVSEIAWSPNGSQLATGDLEGTIRLWVVSTTEPPVCIQILVGHKGWIDGLAFSPDGSRLASAGWDGTVRLWDVSAGQTVEMLDGHTGRVHRVVFSPDGRILASTGDDHKIWLWDVQKSGYRAALPEHDSAVDGLAFTPDSHSLLSCSEDGTMRLWDVMTGRCLRIMHGNVTALLDIDWSPDGRYLVSGGADALVTIFDEAGGSPPRILRGHNKLIRGTAWSPDGRRVATGDWGNTVRLWDPITANCVDVLHYPNDSDNFFYQLAWSPDGSRLACGTYQHGMKIFDMAAYVPAWDEDPLSTWICGIAWSPNGAKLAGGGSGSANPTVYIWNGADGKVLRQMKGHYFMIACVAWSSDGTRLASGGIGRMGGEVLIWDPDTGEQINRLDGHPAVVNGIVWDSDDETLITGGGDGRLRWWNVQSGELLQEREAHHGAVYSLRRSPDGTKVASCGDDGAIMLWDLDSGEHLRTLRRDRPYERLDITGIRGLTGAQKATLRALGAIENMTSD